ncbi:hypothetical protein CEXT_442751 [Caerostris extrusa]|uniref:Uncharacterized protein n=1 Tax=Caerostris extrusa TaxID=172846 RepID=A0AAV4PD88_CAEEX|nr:hypothetical protein CEXT_442751 [Caerostris extrusa]
MSRQLSPQSKPSSEVPQTFQTSASKEKRRGTGGEAQESPLSDERDAGNEKGGGGRLQMGCRGKGVYILEEATTEGS